MSILVLFRWEGGKATLMSFLLPNCPEVEIGYKSERRIGGERKRWLRLTGS